MSGIQSDNATNQALLCESTENFLTGLAQALRAFQFYGASNPAALRSLSTARTSCQSMWEQSSELELQIQENTITLGEKVVYDNEDRTQSLSFLLYKDGVRALKLLKGFEGEDLEALLVVLHKAKHLRNEEDDLITLLWSADFSKIFYSYIDLGEYDEPQLTERENSGSSFTRALAAGTLAAQTSQVEETANTADHQGSADPAALPDSESEEDVSDSAALMSTDELKYLQEELARERDRDVVKDVVNALLDRLEDPEPEIQSEILMILSDLVPSLVLQRRLELAASTLNALRESGDGLADETRQNELQQTLENVGNSSAIEGVLQALEAGDLVTDDDVIGEFLTCIGPSSFETILRIREKTTRNSLRVSLDRTVKEAYQQHPDRFLEICRSQDVLVACAAIQLVGQSSVEIVVEHLVPLLKSPNPRIRSKVLEVMVLHGGTKLQKPLVEALQDTNREVRCAAAWGLGTWRYPEAFAPLQAIIESKEFQEASLNEKRSMFSAFARVGQDKSLEILGRILNKKSLFGKRQPSEMRVCAARSMGALKSPAAEAHLRKAADDKDANVRRAVMRSLMAKGK